MQQLRKQSGLTQEQLAERLFVSRTAVSKWEVGKGYPNIDSLKSISKLFSVSIDDLLSGEELLDLAAAENRRNLKNVRSLLYGALDLMALAFLFLPLYGQREGDYIRTVPLFANAELPATIKAAYVTALVALALVGVVEVLLHKAKNEPVLARCTVCSLVLHAGAVVVFVASNQPYVTFFLFLFFMVKVALALKNHP